MIKSILFLGGSGYICKRIREITNFKHLNIKYYARRECKNCYSYKEVNDIPNSDIIIDFSQWANGLDVEKVGFKAMKDTMLKISKRCSNYIFASSKIVGK